MARRTLRWLLTALLTIWLVALVPGHTRGAITTVPIAPAGESCCAAKHGPATPAAPTPEQKRCCAVCYFTLGLAPATPPPPLPVGLQLLAVCPPETAAQRCEPRRFGLFLSRAPPAKIPA